MHIGHSFNCRAFFEWNTSCEGCAFWDTSTVKKDPRELTMYEIQKERIPFVVTTPPTKLHLSADDWM